MTALNDGWFTEVFQDQGTAFSLQVKKKLHEEQTEFQKLEIWETETFGNLMVLDGCVMLTTRDNFLYHEMMTHPALFTHKDPKKVVIVGGGDCGTLKEVLKHPVWKRPGRWKSTNVSLVSRNSISPNSASPTPTPRQLLLW